MSVRLPRVEERDTASGGVFRIASDQGEIVLEGRGGDKAVSQFQRFPSALTLSAKKAPTFGYGLSHGQDAIYKERSKEVLKPMLQLRSSLARNKQRNSFSEFLMRRNPGANTRIRSWACQF